MNEVTIKPGFLISIKTTCNGGVQYQRMDIDTKGDGNGREITEWQTTRVIEDKDEHQRSVLVRAKCSNMLRLACISTPFGYICPESKMDSFMEIYEDAQRRALEFNASASYTRITVNMMRGRIATDDDAAIKSMMSEMETLAQTMTSAIARGDVKAIRDAATMAKQMGGMLDETAQEKVTKAVEAARKAARDIVKRVEKKGEKLEQVIGEQNVSPIDQMRVAFLDFGNDDVKEETVCGEEESMPAVDMQRVAGIDV